MKIDWKHLANTPGYKSLKQAYINDIKTTFKVKHSLREKEKFYKKFQWVLGIAKHYSYHTDELIEDILNEWESKRNCWWFNYYQESSFPKFHSNSIKSIGIKGLRKKYKKSSFYSVSARKNLINYFIKKQHIKNSTKKKKRWLIKRKKRGF